MDSSGRKPIIFDHEACTPKTVGVDLAHKLPTRIKASFEDSLSGHVQKVGLRISLRLRVFTLTSLMWHILRISVRARNLAFPNYLHRTEPSKKQELLAGTIVLTVRHFSRAERSLDAARVV